MDPVHIEESLVRSLLAFTGTLEAVYRLMDSYMDLKTQSLKASPIEVGLMFTVVVTLSTQPLMSIYQHATFAVKTSPRLLPPYLLYGKEASKFNILSADMKFKITENVHSMEFDHAIIRGYAQPSGLVCERTFFFQQSHNTSELPLTIKPHFNRLTRIYTELLSVLWSVVDDWQNLTHVSLDKILLQAQNLLTRKLQREQYRDLEIKLTYPWQNPTDPVTMVVLSGAVYDILDENGISLGSLVAADTWIISTLRVNQSVISRKAINLTGGVQHVCMWTRSSLSLDLTLFDTSRKPPVMNEQTDLVFPSPGNSICLPGTLLCCLIA
ncbi:hypothetical protein PHET_08399 [Paragonimus heterotremus]|uniref:Uncharacterized protein n=1 Tax=Paragonimus heterotremus TaxID=100268 RepID=A0A8J4SM88_9TREM|nr:hypothetical protein PHET_08399 [Paragonimus heterotremus]